MTYEPSDEAVDGLAQHVFYEVVGHRSEFGPWPCHWDDAVQADRDLCADLARVALREQHRVAVRVAEHSVNAIAGHLDRCVTDARPGGRIDAPSFRLGISLAAQEAREHACIAVKEAAAEAMREGA